MNTEEMIKVVQAFQNGQKIQMRARAGGCWRQSPIPGWNWGIYEYRVAPSKPSVDWGAISDQYNHFAKTPSRHWVLCSQKPRIDVGQWKLDGALAILASPGTACILANALLPEDCPWQESLVSRPGHGEGDGNPTEEDE